MDAWRAIKNKAVKKILNHMYSLYDKGKLTPQIFKELMIALKVLER